MTDDESDPFDASTVDRQTFGELSAGAMVRINDLCDEFERELSESGQVDLQSFIAKLNLDESQESQVLIRELIAVDIHHRTKSGDTPSLADYRSVDPSIREDDFDLMLEDEWPLTSSDPQVGSLQPNQRIGDYLVLEEIGRGGMGHVYRAVHVLMNRMVAIKILTTKVRHDPLARERFKREITSVAKLDHRNIVTAFDARVEQDSLYLVTEWIDGSDMVRLVQKEGPLPPHQVIGIAKQAARGLRYAHDQGLIHRDIKPGNLLLDQEGVVKVLDLGLARMLDEMEDEEASPDALTKSTQIIGTPAFMAPEQARNPLDVDIRSDIYSFGCTLFFLLTGKLPYPGKNRVDSILAHTESETPVLSEVDSEIPEPMSHLVHDLMQKERSLRPATMDTVLDRLIAMEPRGDTIAQSTTATIERERMAAALARDSNVLKDGSNGKRFGLERILLAFALIGVLVGLSFVIFQPDDVSSGDSEQSNTSSVGTWFNGESSYAYSNAFDEPFDEPAMIEVLVTPQAGPSPSNVASWTGENCFYIFVSEGRNWGAGILIDGQIQLEIATKPIEMNQAIIIAGRWDGTQLSVLIDGQSVETTPSEYPLFSTEPMLCFGGLPDGLLPAEQGTRFFTGLIQAARVSKGMLPQPARNRDELLRPNKSCIAQFDFSDIETDRTEGFSSRHYLLQLVDTQ